MAVTVDTVEKLLPQTQCGLCGYGGCRPYAEAIVKYHETLDRCPPGGVATLQKLGEVLQQDVAALLPAMQEKQKPFAVAKIREAECIGCTKCIQACPVDAIIGSGKVMHTVLRSECTGCELCITPCPVDCIEMELLPKRNYDPEQAYKRFYAKQARLANNARTSAAETNAAEPKRDKKAEILAAVARAKAKRTQLS